MTLTVEEVAKHNSRSSCWVIIAGNAYDVTDFLDSHPGGASSILRYAGKDATIEFEQVHPPGTLERGIDANKNLGRVDKVDQATHAASTTLIPQPDDSKLAPLSTLQNLDDFETEAEKVLSRKAWVYYNSASDSLASYKANKLDWSKVSLRPRVLRNVAKVSLRRRIMGHESALPFFIAPAAMAKLGHEDGELCLARGAARFDIPYCTSTYSSVEHAELAKCLTEEQSGGALLFQLYVPVAKENARQLIAEAKRLKFKALVVTVDSAVIGKREADDRYKAELDHAAGVEIPRTTRVAGDAPILRGAHSSTLDWNDLTWIRECWDNTGPFILKGIQTTEDAVMAAEIGVDGVYLSNHGGRQMDFSPSALRTLLEVRMFRPDLFKKMDFFVDGGITRGTDVLKALCLGAKAVGLGRPFMYALSTHGTDGVYKAIQLLSDEVETTMRLLGVTELDQLSEFYVNASALENELPRRIDVRNSDHGSKL